VTVDRKEGKGSIETKKTGRYERGVPWGRALDGSLKKERRDWSRSSGANQGRNHSRKPVRHVVQGTGRGPEISSRVEVERGGGISFAYMLGRHLRKKEKGWRLITSLG